MAVSDTTFAIIKEIVPGQTPATPAFLSVDYIPGTMPVYQSDNVVSQVQKASRGSAGARKTNFSVGGGLALELFRDAAVDLLLESTLSGTFVGAVLKAGSTDTSFTVEQRRVVDGLAADFYRFTGCQVSSMSLTVGANSIGSLNFDIMGMNRTKGSVIITGATYAAPSTKIKLAGIDITAVTVGGVSLVCTDLSINVSHNRETQSQFGSASARGVGTSGFRTVTVELTCYRDAAFNGLETTLLAGDVGYPVSATIGPATGAAGYKFDMTLATVALPTDTVDGSKELVKLTCTASYDPGTALTDLAITRLT